MLKNKRCFRQFIDKPGETSKISNNKQNVEYGLTAKMLLKLLNTVSKSLSELNFLIFFPKRSLTDKQTYCLYRFIRNTFQNYFYEKKTAVSTWKLGELSSNHYLPPIISIFHFLKCHMNSNKCMQWVI